MINQKERGITMYNTNWQEKYNRKAQHEMTVWEVYDMMEWQHDLIQTFKLYNDRRRKYKQPFTMTLEEAAKILAYWQEQAQKPVSVQEEEWIPLF